MNRALSKNYKRLSIAILGLCFAMVCAMFLPTQTFAEQKGAAVVQTPYGEQKAVFEFFFDHPQKIAGGLYWLLGMFHTLNEEPYGIPPDFLDVKVVIHGTEIVTLVKKNYEEYKTVVERMKYYTEFGVEFKVCATSAWEYGYKPEDFHEFVQIVPNGVTEIVHWQMQGYGLVVPQVLEKHQSIDEIR